LGEVDAVVTEECERPLVLDPLAFILEVDTYLVGLAKGSRPPFA
jgi:hypothetical protein